MLSRALILATVILSIGTSAIVPAEAQNLDAGKSPSQIFSSTCSACHRSQRGLLKTVPPGSLPGFLREHYTTSRDMAQQLSAFLLSNGATDNRIGGGRLTKQGEDAKSGRQAGEPRPADAAEPTGRRQRPAPPQEAGRPDADGLAPAEPRAPRTKRGRIEPPQAAPGPDGQPVAVDENALTKRQKQKMGKKKGREEAPKATTAPAEAAKPDAVKPEVAAPAEMPKPPEPAPVVIDPKIDAPKSEPVRPAEAASTRHDPVPQVTPAPSATEPAEPRSAPTPAPSPSEAPAAPAPSDSPPRPTISVTPPPPAPSAGPATAPISQ